MVLPFSALAVFSSGAAAVAVAAILMFVALALLDAWRGMGALDGLAVELPPIARLAKDREGKIDVIVVNEKETSRLLRIGLALPREITSPQEDQTVLLPEATPRARFTWTCTPRKRGSYALTECRLEGASPFGFWGLRKSAATQCDARVYPNLLTERKAVAAIFLSRGHFGVHAQRQVGKGRDFEKLREYVPGDSIEDVHWKATAKHARPMTKVFQVERTQEVYVIIDASRLSARTLGEPAEGEERASLLERFITAGLTLGLAAEKQGDRFGLITFSDKVETFVRAGTGQAHYHSCRDAIYRLQPRAASPDFDELCSFIRTRLRRRALLVFLTSLDDPALAEGFVRAVDLICRQHLVLVNMIAAPEVGPLFRDRPVADVDDLYRELGGHLRWSGLRELENILRRRGIGFAQTQHEKLTAALVTQYMSVKWRQAL